VYCVENASIILLFNLLFAVSLILLLAIAIFLPKGKKQKECASDLNDSNHQNEIFRIAKQMVKEGHDISQTV